MPGLFHDASGKVAHEVRHVYIHACLHALEVAWGRGFVADDLGVPARTLVRLPEVATRFRQGERLAFAFANALAKRDISRAIAHPLVP